MINTIFKSSPELYDIQDNRLFKRTVMFDSIFRMFPYAECIIPDSAGQIINELSFNDQLEVEFGYEIDENKPFTHNYYIKETQLLNIPKNSLITADIKYMMDSTHIKTDEVQSRSFQNSLSSIIDSNIGDFRFADKKITTTSVTDYFYQPEINFFEFIRRHISTAHSTQYDKSPFFCFVNSANIFHFVAIESLVNNNVGGIPEFDFVADDNKIFSENVAKGIIEGGYTGVKFKITNVDSGILNPDATITIDSYKLEDFYSGNTSKKYLTRKADTVSKRDFLYYGLDVESDTRGNYYQGYLNSHYKDSYFPLRLRIMLQYSKLEEICSGNNIKLNIKDKDGTDSPIFSGTWIVLESQHIKSKKDILYSEILVGKHTTGVPTGNKFKADYL